MASTIVPCDCNCLVLIEAQQGLEIIDPVLPGPNNEPDDFYALVAELATAEGLAHIEALGQALELHNYLLSFAALWNIDAALCGNQDAVPSPLKYFQPSTSYLVE